MSLVNCPLYNALLLIQQEMLASRRFAETMEKALMAPDSPFHPPFAADLLINWLNDDEVKRKTDEDIVSSLRELTHKELLSRKLAAENFKNAAPIPPVPGMGETWNEEWWNAHARDIMDAAQNASYVYRGKSEKVSHIITLTESSNNLLDLRITIYVLQAMVRDTRTRWEYCKGLIDDLRQKMHHAPPQLYRSAVEAAESAHNALESFLGTLTELEWVLLSQEIRTVDVA